MSVVAAYGEVLWDLLPDGPVLGGAPFNFVYRMTRLGHEGIMVSAVGSDDLGARALEEIERLGLHTDYVQRSPDLPTGTVNVEFDERGEPHYEIVRDVAYDRIRFMPELKDLARRVDCICFGTLAQRNKTSRATLTAFLEASEVGRPPLKLLDVNLRKDCYSRETVESSLTQADVVKLNYDEVIELAAMFDVGTRDAVASAQAISDRWNVQHVIVTMGEHGAFCASQDASAYYDPGYSVQTVDPCGSGDAFAAAFLHELLRGRSAVDGVRLGNVYGAAVAEHRGATQPIDGNRIDVLKHRPPPRNESEELRQLNSRQNTPSTWTT